MDLPLIGKWHLGLDTGHGRDWDHSVVWNQWEINETEELCPWYYDQPLSMLLTLIDEYTRECLAIDVARGLKSKDVLERLAELFIQRGTPDYIRSDNGAEFTAKAVRAWLGRVGVRTL